MLYRGSGCDHCNQPGYFGRTAVIQLMPVTGEISRLIVARATTADIERAAVAQGMGTLDMLALQKVRDGLSTLDEAMMLVSSSTLPDSA